MNESRSSPGAPGCRCISPSTNALAPAGVAYTGSTQTREDRHAPSDYRLHDLRHTAATLMLASGVDIPTVAAILGHSRNSTTLDVYAHAVPNNLNRAVDAIQRALRADR